MKTARNLVPWLARLAVAVVSTPPERHPRAARTASAYLSSRRRSARHAQGMADGGPRFLRPPVEPRVKVRVWYNGFVPRPGFSTRLLCCILAFSSPCAPRLKHHHLVR